MKKRYLLTLLALAVSTLPVLICAALYFPVWSNRSAGATLSGLGLIIALLAAVPLYRFIRRHISSISAPMLWFILFAIFFALERIAQEMTVIAFVGFVSNLLGAVIFRLAHRRERDEG